MKNKGQKAKKVVNKIVPPIDNPLHNKFQIPVNEN